MKLRLHIQSFLGITIVFAVVASALDSFGFERRSGREDERFLAEISIASPSEYLAAAARHGVADWAGFVRPPAPTNITDRAHIALVVGGILADGHLATMAHDALLARSLSRDLLVATRALGIGEEIAPRGASIATLGERGQWIALAEDFDATKNEIKTALDRQQDDALAGLVTLGAWLRSVHIATGVKPRAEGPIPDFAISEILPYFRQTLELLPPRFAESPAVKATAETLLALAHGGEAGQIHARLGRLMAELERPYPPETNEESQEAPPAPAGIP